MKTDASEMSLRLCDACGAAAHNGPIPMTEPKEVDPRTLPVGAEFRYYRNGKFGYTCRVVVVGLECERLDDGSGERLRITETMAIVISLPPAEVELGTLSKGEFFKFVGEGYPEGTHWVARVHIATTSVVECGSELRTPWSNRMRVIRVPPPTSAGSPETATREAAADTPSCVDVLGSGQPADSKPRWPNTPQSEHARLERMLSEQVATGGQDCLSARSLIERADRLRRENADRELGYIQEVKSRHTKVSGIASLRLERPLISWRRK